MGRAALLAGGAQSTEAQARDSGPATLDPASLQAYWAADRDQEIGALVRSSADQASQQLRSACVERQSQLNLSVAGHPSLEHSVLATLAVGEKLCFSLGVDRFHFAQGNFAPHQAGLLLLTDQRLICLTQCRHATTTMAWQGQTVGPEAQLRSQLRVQHSAGAALWIFPVPHKSLKHLVLESDHHVQAANVLTPTLHGPSTAAIVIGLFMLFPGIALLFAALMLSLETLWLSLGIALLVIGLVVAFAGTVAGQRLFQRAACCNQFAVQVASQQPTAASQSHTLHIAMLMPPWEQQQILRVSVNPRVPLSKLHQFSSHFQSVLARFQEHGVDRPLRLP